MEEQREQVLLKRKKTVLDFEKVIQVLQKFPKDRTKEDIDVIYPYAKHIKLFNQQVQDVAMSEESIKIICE